MICVCLYVCLIFLFFPPWLYLRHILIARIFNLPSPNFAPFVSSVLFQCIYFPNPALATHILFHYIISPPFIPPLLSTDLAHLPFHIPTTTYSLWSSNSQGSLSDSSKLPFTPPSSFSFIYLPITHLPPPTLHLIHQGNGMVCVTATFKTLPFFWFGVRLTVQMWLHSRWSPFSIYINLPSIVISRAGAYYFRTHSFVLAIFSYRFPSSLINICHPYQSYPYDYS